MGLSDADKAGLSPQEIEALEDEDTPGGVDDKPNEPQLSAEELEDEKNDAEVLAAKEKADADAKAAEDAKAKEAAGKTDEVKAEDAKTDEPVDEGKHAALSLDEQIKAHNEKLDALTVSFEKGEIQLAQYNRDMSELVSARAKAEWTMESLEKDWAKACIDFMAEAKKLKVLAVEEDGTVIPGGVDYNDSMLEAALNVAVKEIASKPENAGKAGRWYLMEGHKAVVAKFNLNTEKQSTPEDKAAAEAAVKASGRRPDLRSVPKTLGGLPAASPSETGSDSEFTHLEKLDGLALERAIAKMSPEQQDRYAQTG